MRRLTPYSLSVRRGVPLDTAGVRLQSNHCRIHEGSSVPRRSFFCFTPAPVACVQRERPG
jgi:hypothetical protein